MMEDLQMVLDVVQNFGLWGIFAWLYMAEKKAHNETRTRYFEDLREYAGIRAAITQNRQNLPSEEE
jgi:hypothetical protein